MSEIEDAIKTLILQRYPSIRAFSIEKEIPYSTIDSILKRGVDKASMSSINKLTNALGMSIDDLNNTKQIKEKTYCDDGIFKSLLEIAGFSLTVSDDDCGTLVHKYADNKEYKNISVSQLDNLLEELVDHIMLSILDFVNTR